MCPICIIDVFVRYSAEMIEGKVGKAADICMCKERGKTKSPIWCGFHVQRDQYLALRDCV